VLKAIIHDWDDEAAVRILKNCRRAMRDDGKLLVMDNVLKPVKQSDLIWDGLLIWRCSYW
jgi:O-methyltransferase domain